VFDYDARKNEMLYVLPNLDLHHFNNLRTAVFDYDARKNEMLYVLPGCMAVIRTLSPGFA